jgi:hypothetical protein
MDEIAYGRGQVEWALWRSFTFARFAASEAAPKVFRTRIKRLLEIDRDLDLSDAEVQPEADYAFAPLPSIQGGDTAYQAVDVFCLAIGLDLLDAGFKQTEVVFLLRYLRPELDSHFPDLLGEPSLLGGRRQRAKTYPHLPRYERKGRRQRADKRLFVVLQKLEMTEIMSARDQERHPHPVMLEPIFCPGIAALTASLDDLMPTHRRAVTVLELAGSAKAVAAFLEQAPVVPRGRPKKSA